MNFWQLPLCLILLLAARSGSAANNATWDCQQDGKGEWNCTNDGSPQPKAEPPTSEPAHKPVVTPQETAKAPTPEPKPTQAEVLSTPPTAASSSVASQTPKVEQTPATPSSKPPVQPTVATAPSSSPEKLRVHVDDAHKVSAEKAGSEQAKIANTRIVRSGWNCQSGKDKSAGWDCNLVGSDPKGQAQAMPENEVASTFTTPAFTHQQEATFQSLRAEFKQDPWQGCSKWSSKRKPQFAALPKEARENASTNVNSDFSEIFEGDILNFAGNVDLTRADQHLLAEKASYDTVAETMDAQGSVIYSDATTALAGETASISLGKDEARIRNAQYILPEGGMRGTADVIYRDSKILSRFHEATLTSCPPGNQDWIVHAERVKTNKESGQGSAKNAWVEFKGVPFLYTPYISFPIDNRRLSGFLAPTFGNTQRNGFDTSMPYYWNIAPNYDDILTPRYMAKRGFMLRNKFRYMTDSSKGALIGEILPQDELLNKSRYLMGLKESRSLTDNISSYVDANFVSDKTYFNDLNNALGLQTNRYLPSLAYLFYNNPYATVSAGAHHYQSVDRTLNDPKMPYDILPRVNVNSSREFDFNGVPVQVGMENQYSYFYHPYSNQSQQLYHRPCNLPLKADAPDYLKEETRVGVETKNDSGCAMINAQRLNLSPSISLPLESPAGFLIPRLTGMFTYYNYGNQSNNFDPNYVLPSSVTRALPIMSLDTGLSFEKNINIGDGLYTHTLEPRAFYLYIPHKDQNNIQLFDTAIYDVNYYSLFRENRFSGMDRIQDANQLTLAGTTRLINSKTGLEPLKLTLGQILYFEDRNVNLAPDIAAQKRTTSNFIGEVSGQMTRNLSYLTGAQWDPQENGFARTQAMLKYRNQPDEIFDIGYRYRRTNINDRTTLSQYGISQFDTSFRWPLFAGWYGIGRMQYAFNFNRVTDSFMGIEKENCCWRFRLLGRHYLNGYNSTSSSIDPNSKPETAFFVQLELKGFTSLGDSVDTFLLQNLNGYRKAGYFE